jgi:hypothetical protein
MKRSRIQPLYHGQSRSEHQRRAVQTFSCVRNRTALTDSHIMEADWLRELCDLTGFEAAHLRWHARCGLPINRGGHAR